MLEEVVIIDEYSLFIYHITQKNDKPQPRCVLVHNLPYVEKRVQRPLQQSSLVEM